MGLLSQSILLSITTLAQVDVVFQVSDCAFKNRLFV
jgi:hypothetical protein